MGNSIPEELNRISNSFHEKEKSNSSQMWHICQTHPSQVIRNCFLIWASGTSAHPAHTNKQSKGGDEVVVGWQGGGVLVEGAYYSLPLCVLISRCWPSVVVGMLVFNSTINCKVTPYPHPPFHVLIWGVLWLCVCVCVRQAHTVCVKPPLTFHAQSDLFFFKQILAPTLLLLTVRGFVSYPRYKTPIHSTS